MESIASVALVAMALVTTLSVGAGSVRMALVLAWAAFVVLLAVEAVHPFVTGQALALIGAQGVFADGVGAAVVAGQSALFTTLVHVCTQLRDIKFINTFSQPSRRKLRCFYDDILFDWCFYF
jgi:ABC-type glucose/galactose transport system permease subunit